MTLANEIDYTKERYIDLCSKAVEYAKSFDDVPKASRVIEWLRSFNFELFYIVEHEDHNFSIEI